MKPRLIFDTGALIALERHQQRARELHRAAIVTGTTLVVPTPVVAEWWREGSGEKERLRILRTLLQEPPDTHVAKLAGAAIGHVGAGVIDALVMAAASVRGDTVLTSDIEDMKRLGAVFPGVRLERV